MLAEFREENARYREEAAERERKAEERQQRAERNARRTHAQLDNVQGDLTEVKGELVGVKGELHTVSNKLGIAKDQRVPPARRHQSTHRLVILRLGERHPPRRPTDKELVFTHSVHRAQEKSLATCLANKRRHYPNAKVILDLRTPNGMNLFNRFKERYAHRIEWDGIDVLPIGTYTEDKLLRDMRYLHQTRMTDADLS